MCGLDKKGLWREISIAPRGRRVVKLKARDPSSSPSPLDASPVAATCEVFRRELRISLAPGQVVMESREACDWRGVFALRPRPCASQRRRAAKSARHRDLCFSDEQRLQPAINSSSRQVKLNAQPAARMRFFLKTTTPACSLQIRTQCSASLHKHLHAAVSKLSKS